ncbi:MAG: aminoacyl-tRNA hydrolase [Bryobacteraceae bacterium]
MSDSDGGWLVVGLGNPGPQYEHTPHNMGFLTVDRLAELNGIRINRKDSMALAGPGNIAGAGVLLAKPQTFMNLSGSSVRQLMEKYAIAVGRLILVYDDLDLPWTGVRIRPKGTAPGHNGTESVIRSIKSLDFPRVRVGVHPGHPLKSGADYLLAPMRKAQLQELDEVLGHSARAVESIIAEGVEMAMTKYNRRARGLIQEEE